MHPLPGLISLISRTRTTNEIKRKPNGKQTRLRGAFYFHHLFVLLILTHKIKSMIHERKKAFMISISKNQQKPKQVSADGFLYSFALEEELFFGGVILGAFVGVGGRGLIFNKESGSSPAPIGLKTVCGLSFTWLRSKGSRRPT